jgi:uncharacterized tellurite resistance protein B-like protein
MAANPAAAQPKVARIDYLTVLAAVVGVDSNVAGKELGVLAQFCDDLDLAPDEKQSILAFTRNVDPATVLAACERLKESELRFTVVSDLLFIAYTDDRYAPTEREVIEGIARMMGVSWRQLDAMEQYATSVLRSSPAALPTSTTGDDANDSAVTENAVAGLAAAGVPLAAVAVAAATASGSAVGPVAAGLAVLGMGTVGGGVAAAAALGVGSFFAVRSLYRLIRPS